MKNISLSLPIALAALAVASCTASEPEGLRLAAPGTGAQVKFDVFHKPLPEIPLPNDIATRYDPGSPTGRRVNASMVANNQWERTTRQELDKLDGWSTFGAISVGFDKPLDPEVIFQRHRDNYDFSNDAVYVIDVSPDSPEFCQPVALDMGAGNFPYTIEDFDKYYPNDPRGRTDTLLFEQVEEDLNHNGKLDPGEDTDMDGVLDHPNTRHRDGTLDDLLTFYERETNTLIMRPVVPLREETTYAVVLTRRLLDEDGRPVRSPFKYINHVQQNAALAPLEGCLHKLPLSLDDVSFTWAFTTQSITRDFRAIRDGLYGVSTLPKDSAIAKLAGDFPTDIDWLDAKDKGEGNLKVLPSAEFINAMRPVLTSLMGNDAGRAKAIVESHNFVDYEVFGTFQSPQFFPRWDESVKPKALLPLGEQVWQVNPLTGDAFVRSEKVSFWMTIPKRQYKRNPDAPAPLVILGHGYTGSKMDPISFGGFFARHGIATLGMECPSHGVSVDANARDMVLALGRTNNIEKTIKALLDGRAFDQNGDGQADSGADYWTAYAFHTRDMVRQSTVDYMRLIQILRSWDGTKTWKWDPAKKNAPGLAGDFDGDGKVDVGGDADIDMVGGSLGGIMSSMVAGIEPRVRVAVPIAGGGGLSDIAQRSIQGGVAEAVNLRMFGPLLLTLRGGDGSLELWQYLPDLNRTGSVKLGQVGRELPEGDTAVLTNQKTGDYRCARVQAGSLLRVAVPSDQGDVLSLSFYSGPLPPQDRTGCRIPSDAAPYLTVDKLGIEAKFQGKTYPASSPLIALGDGFGMRRGTPELRSFLSIAQMAMDPGDPINFTPFFERRLMKHTTGEVVAPRVMFVTTIGDMAVPANTGASLARAAGFIDYADVDPRYGKPVNQVLADTYTYEATERIPHHINSSGQSVLEDVDDFSSIATGSPDDGFDVPRLSPPLRLVKQSTKNGGYEGIMFPYAIPTGKHGFDLPASEPGWDLGRFLINTLGHYVNSSGTEYNTDKCNIDYSCSYIPPMPADGFHY